MKIKGLLVAGAMALALAMAAPAKADTVIDFSTGLAGTGGLFTLLAGGQATGANIPIGAMSISGAPVNGGVSAVYAVTNGILTFSTVGNTISITGAISGGPASGTGPSLSIAQGTLLSGSFTSFIAGGNGLSSAIGPDTKSAALLAALGIPAGTPFALFGFSTTTSSNVLVGGSSTVISTDIRNTAVPEPGSMLLLGSGLLGLGGVIRRRFKK